MKNNIDLFDHEYKATTPFDGVYTGLIVGVESSGKKRFRVTGVIKPALPLLLNGNRRKGFRPGDEIVIPGHAVQPTDSAGTDYLTAIRIAIKDSLIKSEALAKSYLALLKEMTSAVDTHQAKP